MTYRIVPQEFTTPTGEYYGAFFHDFFDCDLSAEYATADDAEESARDAYRGRDVDGIGVIWSVERAD